VYKEKKTFAKNRYGLNGFNRQRIKISGPAGEITFVRPFWFVAWIRERTRSRSHYTRFSPSERARPSGSPAGERPSPNNNEGKFAGLMVNDSWYFTGAKLFPNVKGCGYPPMLNCSIFYRQYANIGQNFSCYYSKVDPGIVISDLDMWQVSELHFLDTQTPLIPHLPASFSFSLSNR